MDIIVTSLFVAFLWGLTPIIHKHVLNTIDPLLVFVLSGIVFGVGAIILLFVNRDGSLVDKFRSTDTVALAWIVAAQLVTMFATMLYLQLLQKHHSYVVTALTYSSPVFTLILAYLILNEKVSIAGAMGVLLIVAGIALLAFNERGHRERFLESR